MGEDRRFNMRLDLKNPRHARAWEILMAQPERTRSLYIVSALISQDEIKAVVKEAMTEVLGGMNVTPTESGQSLSLFGGGKVLDGPSPSDAPIPREILEHLKTL